MVIKLLAAGAAVDKAIDDGETPLQTASQNGHTDVLNEMLAAGATR